MTRENIHLHVQARGTMQARGRKPSHEGTRGVQITAPITGTIHAQPAGTQDPRARARARARARTRARSRRSEPRTSLSSLFSLFLFLSLSLSVKRRQEQRYVHRPTGLKGSVAIGDVVTALGQVSVLFAQLQHIPSMRILCLDNVHTLSATPRARARSPPLSANALSLFLTTQARSVSQSRPRARTL